VEIGELVAPPGAPATAASGKTYSCPWSNCKADHPQELQYPNDGNVSRGSGLRGLLEGAGQEPWNGGGYGVSTKPIYLRNGKEKRAADGSPFTQYRLQAHHLIPVKQMGKTGTLKSNAVLAGWDIDALANGMFLPQDAMDMAIHALQQHQGSHCSKYTVPIGNELRDLEKAFAHICRGTSDTEIQQMLKMELDAISALATDKILGIRTQSPGAFWELHNGSLTAFKAALAEYARRKALGASAG
jgi:A nuclease family of the HNH/ENDO VII superfamily with conserved AHH